MTMSGAIAAKPPLGWNSYDCYNASVTEAEVKANADFITRHLARYDWEYVVVDYVWSHPAPPLTWNPNQTIAPDGAISPLLAMDEVGRLLPAPNRFPSAASGQGFKPLSDYVHSLGLKFGIHVMRGIPRQAAWKNMPILGAPYRAADVADPQDACNWNNNMVGVDMRKPGAQAYYDSIFQLYAAWGVDYCKVDDISYPYHQAEIEGVRAAIDHCGRPIVLSLSPGETPLGQAEHVQNHAHLWRISGDFWDNWEQLVKQFALCAAWAPFAGPGHWPDADMLPIGHLSVRGPWPEARTTNFTRDEQITLMTLFAIARSPLMIGANLPTSDEFTISLLTNAELMDVNQNSTNHREAYRHDGHIAWCADAPSRRKFAALFNLGDQPAEVSVALADLGLSGACRVRDVWAHQDVAQAQGQFSRVLPAHGAGLYRLSPA
jgi:hypothetical protein